MNNEVTMYRKTKLGVGTWRCWSEGATVYIAHAQCVGGSEVVHREVVPAGLAGRSLAEQVESRVRSRVNKQRDRGYVDSLEEATTAPRTNQLNLPLPMLAKKISDIAWPGKVIVQPKLDGFRCLATRNDDGDVICYTRGGKLLPALEHICAALEPTLPGGVILDGEIYEHGKSLQSVASLAKKKQRGTENLVYHAYDCIDDGPFVDRYEMVMDVLAGIDHDDRIQLVPNEWAKSMDEVWDIFAKHRSNGFEGAMVRVPGAPYDSGGRSYGLLKVKAREDEEFKVLDVVEDANGCGVLVCEIVPGKTFRTLAPGSHDQKRFVLLHKDQYVGRMVTVEFAYYTKDGVPFHAVATRWRTEL